MKKGFLAITTLLIATAALAVSPATESYLVSVGAGAGACVSVPAGGQVCSQWVTDVWIFNPSASQSASVSIYFLERDKANTSPDVRTVTVAAGETRALADILTTTFGYSKKFGGLRFVADTAVVVTGRIFDSNVVGNTGVSGTAGQFFAGLPAGLAIGLNQESSVIGLAQDTTWRSNIFLTEVTGNTATVEVARLDGTGVVQTTASYSLKAREVKQLNKVIETLGSTNATNQRIRVTVTAGSGKVLTGGAIVDGRTADPTSVEMVTAALGQSQGRFDGIVFTSDGIYIDGGIELLIDSTGVTEYGGITGMECAGVVVDFSDSPTTPLAIGTDGSFTGNVTIPYIDGVSTVFTTTWTVSGTLSSQGVVTGTLVSVTTGGAGDYSSCNQTVTRSWQAGWTGQ